MTLQGQRSALLGAALLCAACGGRTAVSFEDYAPSPLPDAGGSASRPPAPSWSRVTWDEPFDDVVVYLWTGSATDTWAVGAASESDGGAYVRNHWDGVKWTRTPSPHNGEARFGDQQLWGAPSGRAFGGSAHTLERWDGAAWIDVPGSPACRALGGTAENDIWCSDDELLWHGSGGRWSSTPLSGVSGLLALSENDVWAWGTNGALHYDGSSWTSVLSGAVRSVAASDPNDVWAIQDGELLHCQGAGTPWSRQNPTGSQISGVWSQAKTNTWIVAAGATMRWNGSKWVSVRLPAQDEWLHISGSSEDVWLAGTLKLLHGRAAGN